jgi:hypothetical protein
MSAGIGPLMSGYLSSLLKNEALKSSTFSDHTFYARSLWSDSTFWQAVYIFQMIKKAKLLQPLDENIVMPPEMAMRILSSLPQASSP